MDLRRFVAEHRGSWERLERILGKTARGGLRVLSPDELRELGLLHRQVSADLAAARTFHEGSSVAILLNDLALRSHNVVYRARRRSPGRVLADLAVRIPVTVRGLAGPLAASILLFATGILLGAVGVLLDEAIAVFVLGSAFVQSVRDGSSCKCYHWW